MKKIMVYTMIFAAMALMWSVSAFASIVDITSKVTWDSTKSMYIPNNYNYMLGFEGYTPDNERVMGALFFNFTETNKFDMYISNSLNTDPLIHFGRFTLEKIPDLNLPYSVVDNGSLSSSESGVKFKYSYSGESQPFGSRFLDWQIGASNPIPKNSAGPGEIYYASIQGAGTVDVAEILAKDLKASVKLQGGLNSYFAGDPLVPFTNPHGPVSAPELPPFAMPLLVAALGMGLYLRARFAR